MGFTFVFISIIVTMTLHAMGSRIPTQNRADLFRPEARWIWDGGPDKPMDSYRLFRRSFDLNAKPGKATLRITADAEYRLFVNGKYVARGPAPNPPSRISVDEIDIAPQLRRSKNVIGVIVYHLGVTSFPRVLGRAGLLAQLDLPGSPIVTDGAWKWHDAWWEPTGERFSGFREFTEHLDARKEPVGWTGPNFDDSHWKPAVPIGPAGTAPWTGMEPRDIPMPDHRPKRAKVVQFARSCSNVVPAKKSAAADLASQSWQRGIEGEPGGVSLTDGTKPMALVRATDMGKVIGMDFGEEVSGFPEFSFDCDADGVVVDVGYGEGIDPDGHVSIRRQGNPDADRLTLRKGLQTLRVFHHRAFRYMVIAIRGGTTWMTTPVVIESGYPVAMKGEFSCSDPQLTKIWQVGRRTMQICMDQGFMDCPWRERGQYIGDGLAELPAALYAFGDTALMRRFLRQAQFCQPADGMLEPAYPNDWTPWHGQRGPNRIPGYGALWVVMLEQYYRATGEKALIRELFPTMERLLAWFRPHIGKDGLIESIPEWNFIDWARLDSRSSTACLNLQYLMARQAAMALVAQSGGIPETIVLKNQADAFRAKYWDESRGLYRDGPGIYSVHTNALALLALDFEPARASRIIAGLEGTDLVKPESPYFEGFVLRALCKHGRHDLALKSVREKWGHMIDQGATTFWESFSGQWSLCHAWSCTPTALLSEEILGVTYDAVSGQIRIAPHTVGLTHASGVAPITCGDVNVRWEQTGDEFRLRVNGPPGKTVVLDVPATEGSGITVNGRAESTFERQAGRARATLRGGNGKLEVIVSPR